MKIREYLAEKYRVERPTVMTYREAKIFGVPWPLKKGWLDAYGDNEISVRTAALLTKAMIAREADGVTGKTKFLARQGREASKRAQRIAAWKPVVDPSGDGFLASYEWRRVRMLAIQKYGRRCQCCGASPADGVRLNVDHIKPRAIYPELALSLDNLQVLCSECNHGKGNWDMTDWRKTEEA